MADDVKLEVLLQAKNQSEAAFRELKGQLTGLQQDMAKTAKAAESSFNWDKMKAGAVAGAAAIYAAFRTIGQVVEMSQAGVLLDKQAKAFDNLAASAGTSAGRMVESLKQASGGMIAEADLMAAAGKAMLMNIPAEKISELMKIAAATSRATGQTMTEAFNDITLGVARQSRMILDNLGIIVDVDKANQDYARSLGKTADALSDTEKRQAFMNSVLKSGEDMIRRIGSSQGSLDGVAKATSEWTDAMAALSKKIAEESNPLFEAVAGVLRRINMELKAGSDAAREYGSSIASIDARIAELNKKYGDMESRKSWGYNEPQDVEYRRLMARRKAIPMEGMTDFGRGNVRGRFGSLEPEFYGGRRVSDNEIAYDADARWKSYLEQIEAAKKESEKAWKEYMSSSSGLTSYGAWEDDYEKLELLRQELIKTTQAASEFNMELYKKASEGDTRRLEKEIPFLQKEGLDEQINEIAKSMETGFDYMVQLSERTAERMQDNFSNLFFDAFKGELKSLDDYANAIFESIQRAAADMAGQMATEAIFGSKSVGATSGGGGLMGSLGGWLKDLFGGGGPELLAGAKGLVFGQSGAVPFARGGVVNRPTIFPFAGGTGLMGEAGPEAIMPLKRLPSGRLGVESASDGGLQVVINNNAPGVQVAPREEIDPSGLRRLIVDVVAADIAGGGDVLRAHQHATGVRRRGRY